MTTWERLLCRLGLHRWGKKFWLNNQEGWCVVCHRCGRHERTHAPKDREFESKKSEEHWLESQ